jgi:hypothetical protein
VVKSVTGQNIQGGLYGLISIKRLKVVWALGLMGIIEGSAKVQVGLRFKEK